MPEPVLERWRRDPRGQPWWDAARRTLATSPPVSVSSLTDALITASAAAGAPLPEAALREAAALPAGAFVHLGWTVRNLAQAGGYIPAASQEACLQLYGGPAFASDLNRASDAFRLVAAPATEPVNAEAPQTSSVHAPVPQQPTADEDGDASLARAALSARRGSGRGRRGRGRGARGRGAREPPPPPADHLLASQGEARADPEPPSTAQRAQVLHARHSSAAADSMLRGLLSLDAVSLQGQCQTRVLTLQAAPSRTRGTLRAAMRYGLRCIVNPETPEHEVRGWKLFCLAPRMLLHRSPGQSSVPAAELDRRCELFRAGDWADLLEQAAGCVAGAPSSQQGRSPPSDGARAHRAPALVHLDELSAASRALTAEPLAPGNDDTLAELTDPDKRPPHPYAALPDAVLAFQAEHECPLPMPAFLAALRGARRGSAAGPSGTTAEHRTLLDDEEDSRLLHAAALSLVNAYESDALLRCASLMAASVLWLSATSSADLSARCRARSVPPPSRAAAISAFTLRWFAVLSDAAPRFFAANLLSLPHTGTANFDGELPPLSDILADSPSQPPFASRVVLLRFACAASAALCCRLLLCLWALHRVLRDVLACRALGNCFVKKWSSNTNVGSARTASPRMLFAGPVHLGIMSVTVLRMQVRTIVGTFMAWMACPPVACVVGGLRGAEAPRIVAQLLRAPVALRSG
ncbi:unnamed protein product [Symbiodinium sp. CCMP2592]|nr:unnamed protein product [Symbiodinium sp. CCMP2592]